MDEALPGPQIDRRAGERRVETQELSPEFLAVLSLCGGQVRASDAQRTVRSGSQGTDRRRKQDP